MEDRTKERKEVNARRGAVIPLNVCPTSNVRLGRAQGYGTHPIRRLYDHGVRVTVNTDDVIFFDQGVSDEFLNLYRSGAWRAEELDEIRRNSLAARAEPRMNADEHR